MSILMFIFVIALVALFVGLIISVEGAGMGLIGLIATLSLGFIFPHIAHNRDLSVVDNQTEMLNIQLAYKEGLVKQLEAVSDKGSSLVNHDSPVATVVNNLAEAEANIVEAKKDILDAEMSIQERERGITAYILWFF